MSDTGNISDGGQKQRPKRVRVMAGAVAGLVVLAIGAAAISSHQDRENQTKQQNDQLSHCIDLATSGVPNDELPAYCQ